MRLFALEPGYQKFQNIQIAISFLPRVTGGEGDWQDDKQSRKAKSSAGKHNKHNVSKHSCAAASRGRAAAEQTALSARKIASLIQDNTTRHPD